MLESAAGRPVTASPPPKSLCDLAGLISQPGKRTARKKAANSVNSFSCPIVANAHAVYARSCGVKSFMINIIVAVIIIIIIIIIGVGRARKGYEGLGRIRKGEEGLGRVRKG